ncbi:hypothetical protein Tco_0281561 [Tanacetum coccineum]
MPIYEPRYSPSNPADDASPDEEVPPKKMSEKMLKKDVNEHHQDQDPRSQACKRNFKGIPKDTRGGSILDSDNEEVEEVFIKKDLSIEPMDEVVDDAWKKVEAPLKNTPKKTRRISRKWSMRMPITRRVDGLSYGYWHFFTTDAFLFCLFKFEATNNKANLILFLADNDPSTNHSWCSAGTPKRIREFMQVVVAKQHNWFLCPYRRNKREARNGLWRRSKRPTTTFDGILQTTGSAVEYHLGMGQFGLIQTKPYASDYEPANIIVSSSVFIELISKVEDAYPTCCLGVVSNPVGHTEDLELCGALSS